MSSRYINNGSYATSGYTLSGAFQSLTIGSKGSIGGSGLTGPASEAFTIVNRGRITGSTDGILLKGGGFVTNGATTARISGVAVGVLLDKHGSVSNNGTIVGSGTKATGVELAAGGTVTNSGTVSLIEAQYLGVEIAGAQGTVTNGGTIQAGKAAVDLTTGDFAINLAGALIQSSSFGTLGGTSDMVTNGGTISFLGGTGDLVLNDPSGKSLGFAGVISGLKNADRIDLATFAFSAKLKFSWAQSGGKGTLTVTDGSDVAKITLFGQYVAAGFHAATDGHGGTFVTYTAPPSQQAAVAPPHH